MRFEWVKGHAGHPANERADDLARGAATAYQQGGSVPSGPGWPGVADGGRNGQDGDLASQSSGAAPASPQAHDTLF